MLSPGGVCSACSARANPGAPPLGLLNPSAACRHQPFCRRRSIHPWGRAPHPLPVSTSLPTQLAPSLLSCPARPPARSYGTGYRFKLRHTRAIVDAIHSGELAGAEYDKLPIFNLAVPKAVSNVPSEFLMPINTWAGEQARGLRATCRRGGWGLTAANAWWRRAVRLDRTCSRPDCSRFGRGARACHWRTQGPSSPSGTRATRGTC
jgi:hypothetical protein